MSPDLPDLRHDRYTSVAHTTFHIYVSSNASRSTGRFEIQSRAAICVALPVNASERKEVVKAATEDHVFETRSACCVTDCPMCGQFHGMLHGTYFMNDHATPCGIPRKLRERSRTLMTAVHEGFFLMCHHVFMEPYGISMNLRRRIRHHHIQPPTTAKQLKTPTYLVFCAIDRCTEGHRPTSKACRATYMSSKFEKNQPFFSHQCDAG